MNSKSAPLFWLLQQYFIVVGSACGIGRPLTVSCSPPADTVDCDTPSSLSGSQYVTCYSFGQFMSYTDAETFCRNKGAQLPLLQESSKNMDTVKGILVAHKINDTWIAPSFGHNLTNFTMHCPAFTGEQIETLNCDMRLQVICEKQAVFASGHEKPYIHMKARGDHEKRILHWGTGVVITCSVIRDKAQQLYIQVQREVDEALTFKGGAILHIATENLTCGVKTIGELIINKTHVELFHIMHIRCFLGAPKLDSCTEQMKSCVAPLPYHFKPKPDKPNVQVNVDATFGATVFEPDDIVANCSAILDTHCTIVWALTEAGEQHRFLKQGDSGVQISGPTLLVESGERTWLSSVRLTTDGRGWSHKAVTLTCYSVQDEQKRCEKDDFWCRAVTFYVRPLAKQKIYYDRPPNVVYVGNTLEARCLLHVGEAKHIAWSKFKRYQTGSGHQLQSSSHTTETGNSSATSIQIKEVTRKDDYKLSILHIRRITAIDSEITIACFPSTMAPTKLTCEQMRGHCVVSDNIWVIEGPKPPTMNVFFKRHPSDLLVDTDLTGECDAVIGHNGTLMWVLYINSTIITETDADLNITISRLTNTFKNRYTRRLTIRNVSDNLVGLVIACFSYNIRLFPSRRMRCEQDDPLCNVTVPLNLYTQRVSVFRFGQDKIFKYVLLWLAWLTLVVGIHLYIWYGPPNCYPSGSSFGGDGTYFLNDGHVEDDAEFKF